jgi:hypothetical protein
MDFNVSFGLRRFKFLTKSDLEKPILDEERKKNPNKIVSGKCFARMEKNSENDPEFLNYLKMPDLNRLRSPIVMKPVRVPDRGLDEFRRL